MARCVLGLAVLAGCDGVFGIDRLDPPPDAGACFHETFDGGLTELAANWDRSSDNMVLAAEVRAGLLIFDFPAGATDYVRIQLNRTIDLEGKAASIEATQVLPAGTAEVFFAAATDLENWVGILGNAGDIAFRQHVGGADVDLVPFAYDRIAHRYWRIAHDAGQVQFLTSADGESWTMRAELKPKLSPRSMIIEVGAGAYDTGYPLPQAAIFDNVTICPPP